MPQEDPSSADLETADRQAVTNATPPQAGHRTFLHVLVNTALANVITSFLWFALTFWVYLETRSVLATGLIGGAYMLLVAFFGLFFGVLVDRYRKHAVMVGSTLFSVACFGLAGLMFLLVPEDALLSLTRESGSGSLPSWYLSARWLNNCATSPCPPP